MFVLRSLVKHFASSGEFVGDGERQRAVSVRNRRNFRQVESKDLCWSSPPSIEERAAVLDHFEEILIHWPLSAEADRS